MKTLTEKEYVEKKGLVCPVCGSSEIEGGPVDVDAGYAYQEVGCIDCEASWNDWYVLAGYDQLEVGEEQ